MSTNPGLPSPVPDVDPLYYEGRYPNPLVELAHGGWPGVTYAFVAVQNQKSAMQRGGWLVPNGGKVYTIGGPRGTMDCVIMGFGEPIRGADPSNGIRRWVVDPDLERGTGVSANKGPIPGLREETPNAAGQGKKQEGRERQHTTLA